MSESLAQTGVIEETIKTTDGSMLTVSDILGQIGEEVISRLKASNDPHCIKIVYAGGMGDHSRLAVDIPSGRGDTVFESTWSFWANDNRVDLAKALRRRLFEAGHNSKAGEAVPAATFGGAD